MTDEVKSLKKEVAVLNEAILRKNTEIKALKAEVRSLCQSFDEISKLSQSSFRQGLAVQLDEVNYYKKEVKDLKETLEFYSKPHSYDGGKRARKTLGVENDTK